MTSVTVNATYMYLYFRSMTSFRAVTLVPIQTPNLTAPVMKHLGMTSVKINIERVETLRWGVITKVRRTATLEYSQAEKKFQQDADEVVQDVYDFLHDEFMDNFV